MVIIIVLFLQRLTISVNYYYQKDSHYLKLTVHLARFRMLEKKINLKQQQTHNQTSHLADLWKGLEQDIELNNFSQLMHTVVEQLKTTKYMVKMACRHLTIKQLVWKTTFGTGEASSAGLVAGGLWMVKGTVLGLLSELATMNCEPKLSVIPYFQQKGYQSEIDCMVSIRLGKAIHTIMQMQRHGVKKAIYT